MPTLRGRSLPSTACATPLSCAFSRSWSPNPRSSSSWNSPRFPRAASARILAAAISTSSSPPSDTATPAASFTVTSSQRISSSTKARSEDLRFRTQRPLRSDPTRRPPPHPLPEVLAKKGYDGAKIDVWSCGFILFVLNAGYLPFNDHNLMVMYRKIYKGEFRIPKWTSPDLRRLLTRLLDTNPQSRITIEEIIHDPWFKHGYDDRMSKFHLEDPDMKLPEDGTRRMNAFDIISGSPGFNLSGLFGDARKYDRVERFVSALTAERVVEKLEETAATENLTVARKEACGMKIEGQKGKFHNGG